MRKKITVFTLGVSISLSALAVDLGVVGNTFPIKEPSMFAILAVQMSKVDWKKVNQKIANDAKHKVHNMKYADVSLAIKDKFRLVDPTIILKEDITSPTVDGGVVTLAKRGQKVNPLNYTKPITKMFFFDPSNEDQLELALAEDKKHPNQIYLVAVGGDIAGLAKKVNKPIFYAYDWIVKKLNVKRYPALVGTRGKYVAIGEMATIDQQQFKRYWNEMD